MNIRILAPIAGLALQMTGVAENARFLTITHTNGMPPATLEIFPGEAAELVSMSRAVNLESTYVMVRKDGMNFLAFPAGVNAGSSGVATGVGTTVAGPALFTLNESGQSSVYATFKITTQSFDPNKTLILPPGNDQFQVSLESSTNLVQWNSATNGVYGSPAEARFFRIRMEKK